MARTLQEYEGTPAEWPELILNYGEFGEESWERIINPVSIWARIESWTTRRFPLRTVTYIVEGPGEWTARLHPFTAETCEAWVGGAWESCEIAASPLGLDLPGSGPYRITGTAGDGVEPPPDYREAAQRYYEFARGVAHSFKTETAETEGVAHNWAARGLILSGAADLLRPYRRIA